MASGVNTQTQTQTHIYKHTDVHTKVIKETRHVPGLGNPCSFLYMQTTTLHART